jgi:hypothetical protein
LCTSKNSVRSIERGLMLNWSEACGAWELIAGPSDNGICRNKMSNFELCIMTHDQSL